MAPIYEGQLGADMKAIVQDPNDAAVVARLSAVPQYNAQLRTTCVATMLSGGHAENALPQTAAATVNCRILPVDKPSDVERTLNQVVADSRIVVTPMLPPKPIPFTGMNQKVLSAVTTATGRHWSGLSVIPNMATGAGIPAYAVSVIFNDEDDDRNHGRDERILVKSFYEAVDFMYTLASTLGKTD
jgi:acetylornithine deacetylase/succinyl-diaminopimelate desuccinylase-like protein